MKKFLKRLDRLADRMIDSDSLVPEKGRIQPVQIKTIFDNLRYYTVLAFLWAGVQLLLRDGASHTAVAAVVLAVLTFPLAMLVFMQSSYILLTTTFGVFAALLAPRTAVRLSRRLRSHDILLKSAVLLMVVPIMGAAVLLATAIISALIRAGIV